MLTCNDFAPIVHVLLIPIAKTSFVVHSITGRKSREFCDYDS